MSIGRAPTAAAARRSRGHGATLCLAAALVTCTAALAPQAAQAGAVTDRITRTGQLVIGHRETSVPFSYVVDGRPVGYAIDLCRRLAESVRRGLNLRTLDVRFQPVTSANRIDKVAAGEVDLECGSTTNNAERRKRVAFTIPHYIAGARLLVREGSGVTELRDLAGKRVVSTAGSTPLRVVRDANSERGLKLSVLEAPDHAKAVEMVARDEADAFVMDDVLLYGLIAGRTGQPALEVTGKMLSVEPIAIAMPRDDPAFKKLVDDEMRRLIASREAYALYERWFLQPIPPRDTALKLPMNHLLRDFWKYPTDRVPE